MSDGTDPRSPTRGGPQGSRIGRDRPEAPGPYDPGHQGAPWEGRPGPNDPGPYDQGDEGSPWEGGEQGEAGSQVGDRALPPRTPSGSSRRRRGLPQWVLVSAAVVIALVLLAGGFALWANHEANPGQRGAAETVSLPGGPASSLGSALASRKVVSQGWLFSLYARVKGDVSVQPGTYLLHRDDSYSDVLSTLSAGPPQYRLTIPEGFTLDEIAARVGAIRGHSSAAFLAAARSGRVRSPYEPAGSTDLEGLLFPDTYTVSLGESDDQIIQQMVSRFDQVADQVGLSQASPQLGVTPYQAVIVASIVEREAKLAQDRGKVARVVYNRLAAGMRLQIDSTVIYGLGGRVTNLTNSDLKIPTPYNTYLIQGLPPTPIANPGIPSLQAALSPTPGPWLYYVVTSPDGGESFCSDYACQQANEALAASRGLG